MTKHMSWTGTHPAVDLWAEARQERDEWQARAEAAEQLADKHWQTIIERNKTITARDIEIVEWQENYDELETMFANCKRLEAQAQDRVAELEAQLRTLEAQAAYYGCPHCGRPITLPAPPIDPPAPGDRRMM